MRPIERSSSPTDRTGSPKQFREYQDARGDLIDRLGEYCSYCEMQLDASLAVEHVQPKSLNSALKLEWSNFLLACTNCNSTKGDRPINLKDYYWSDRDNTYRAFKYLKGGLIHVNSDLTNTEIKLASATLKLTGLDKISAKDLRQSDRRQSNRRDAWEQAEIALKRLKSNPIPALRDQIVDTAKNKGFWSLWMTVFQDDTDMLNRFIAAFPGTCKDCFDRQGKPLPRPGGAL